MNFKSLHYSSILFVCLITLFPMLQSCSRKAPTGFAKRNTGTQTTVNSQEHFVQAIKMLTRIEDNDSSNAVQQILYRLNNWIKAQEKPNQWSLDPLHAQIPSHLEKAKGTARSLSQFQFIDYDFYFLRESAWLRDIAHSLVSRKTADLSKNLSISHLGKTAESLGADAVKKLQTAEWLFDWTIRNIQLEELTISENDDEILSDSSKGYVWEALKLGRGNELLRARIFILLARQQGIDVILLGFRDGQASEPKPWLPAVVLENQLFLFDMSLGLPILGPGGQGIATLEEVRTDESLLRALDLDETDPYRIATGELKNIVAMIDATPPVLSQRMKIVEKNLTGEDKMVLSTIPSMLAQKLRSMKGISGVQLWLYPYETNLYYYHLNRDPQARAEKQRPLLIFKSFPPLFRGRQLHFRGLFEKQVDQIGAINYYMQCRTPDRDIEKIESSAGFQQLLSAYSKRLPAEEARKKALEDSVDLLRTTKQNATYWLGLLMQEDNRYDTAIHYFEALTLKASPNGPWTAGAQYNLARIYESLGEFEKAKELYLADQSPQRHGNLLRARRLKKEKTKENDSKTP